jgi:hypothetical protein
VLSAQGGGASERHAYVDLFLSPLPPTGSTRLLCAWPWLGIGDQMTLLPTDEILAAAANVVELWPWEPGGQRPRPVVSAPETPDDSWFSSTRWPSTPG